MSLSSENQDSNRLQLAVKLPWAILYESCCSTLARFPICSVTVKLKQNEGRQTGGGEVPKEAELTDFEMRFLEESILTLPLSAPFDSDSTDIEISKPQYPSTSTSASLIPPVIPSQNTDKITEHDSSSDPLNLGGPTGKILRPSSVALKSKNQEINRLQLAVKLPWAIFFESVDILS
ncbi:hypothetical protein TNCV_1462751 [Trichonephila clavipes]|nr:hypothetical protein TNCV_1462751 [Trichonephila clavipes]